MVCSTLFLPAIRYFYRGKLTNRNARRSHERQRAQSLVDRQQDRGPPAGDEQPTGRPCDLIRCVRRPARLRDPAGPAGRYQANRQWTVQASCPSREGHDRQRREASRCLPPRRRRTGPAALPERTQHRTERPLYRFETAGCPRRGPPDSRASSSRHGRRRLREGEQSRSPPALRTAATRRRTDEPTCGHGRRRVGLIRCDRALPQCAQCRRDRQRVRRVVTAKGDSNAKLYFRDSNHRHLRLLTVFSRGSVEIER